MANWRFRPRDGALLLTIHCREDDLEPWPDGLTAEDDVHVEPGERVTLALHDRRGRSPCKRYWLYPADGVPGNMDRTCRRTWGWRGTTTEGGRTTTVDALGVWQVESVTDRAVTLRYVGGRDDPPDAGVRMIMGANRGRGRTRPSTRQPEEER